MSKIRLTIAGFLALFLHGLIIAAPGAILPQWTLEFGKEPALESYYNIFLIGSVIGLRLTSVRKQRHPLLILAFASVGIGLALGAVIPSFTGVLITAGFVSLGDGILNLQANSLIGELNPQRRVSILNWANATFGFGALSCPLLASFLPWRAIFTLMAAMAFLCIFLAWQAPVVENFNPKKDKMPWGKAMPFLLMIFLYTGLESALGTWSGKYLLNLGWEVTATSTLLSIYWGCLTVGRLILAGWVSRKPMQALACLTSVSVLALGLTLIPTTAFVFPVVAFSNSPLFATVFALVQTRCGHVALSYLFYAAYIGKNIIAGLFSLIENPAYLPYGFLSLSFLLCLLSWSIYRSFHDGEVHS